MSLTRKQFRDGIFARDESKCIICGCGEGLDAHHIIERRLWGSSYGYYLDNGATLCERHHIEAEQTVLTCEEIREKAIVNEDKKPTHILIEGDNYHALKCLNYTHRGKIDLIYIDPPYNTGSDGFRYKDKRFIKKFPDGTEVPKHHPFRHSYWLSFMSKRLELAKSLLSNKGMIFISIDDNEVSQLKLLCDKIFNGKNFVGQFTIQSNPRGAQASTYIADVHEYLLLYAKSYSQLRLGGLKKIISVPYCVHTSPTVSII